MIKLTCSCGNSDLHIFPIRVSYDDICDETIGIGACCEKCKSKIRIVDYKHKDILDNREDYLKFVSIEHGKL